LGWALGLFGGIAEYWMLRKFITGFTQGKTSMAIVLILAKLLTLIGVLLIVLVFWKSQIIGAGVMMAGTLIMLSVAQWFHARRKGNI